MARRFAGGRLVIASHNPGKVREIAELLAPYRGRLRLRRRARPARARGDRRDASQANAELKALAAARAADCRRWPMIPAWSVDALGGAPGIYSARWAGPKKDFAMAMQRVERQLGPDADRRAHFVSVLSLAWPDGHVESFEGEVAGPPRLAAAGRARLRLRPDLPARWAQPDLRRDGSRRASMQISHRAVAFRQLVAACFQT